jgi:hypothetical protein
MKRRLFWAVALVAAVLTIVPVVASAQIVRLPPDGKNQKASVSQWIGLVEVNVTYNAPKVTAPDGTDRTGKIWGQLVPYGMANLGFGTCGDQCPWRAGANENTVFRVSHDVKVEGQPLAAGSYGGASSTTRPRMRSASRSSPRNASTTTGLPTSSQSGSPIGPRWR